MSDTFLEMQDELLREVALVNNADAREAAKGFLNRAKRKAWHAKPWRERRAVGTLTTVAPITTGTVTTNGTETVAGSGTGWPIEVIGRKFALGLSQPWYTVVARANDSEITLDRPVLEPDVTGASCIIYQDVYSLASDCYKLNRKRLALMRASQSYPVDRVNEADFLSMGVLPRNQGQPTKYRLYTESSENPDNGVPRIQLWPVPSDASAIHYEYLKTCTAMVDDDNSTQVQFRKEIRHLIVAGARADMYRYAGEHSKIPGAKAEYAMDLRQAWNDHGRDGPSTFVRRGVGSSGRHGRRTLRFDVEL